jgi:hypothetical protein
VAGKPDLTTASAQQPVRVIVRFSLHADTGSVVRNEIRDHLTGFTRTKTGTWESESLPMHAATAAIRRMLRILRDAESLNSGTVVSHVWIYLDRTLVDLDEDEDDEQDD